MGEQEGLPPGHPPIPGQPPTGPETEALPPGHPPMGGMGQSEPSRRQNAVTDDRQLPKGTAIIEVRGPSGALSNQEVKLKVKHQSVAAGDKVSEKALLLDRNGEARFDNLQTGSGWVYGVRVEYGGIPYESPTFQLSQTGGKRVRVRVFETISNMDEAPVGTQCFVVMEPRDEVVQVEQLFRFTNIGSQTWKFSNLEVALPAGFKAFSGAEGERVQGSELKGKGVALAGFVPPGVTEFTFRYQVPYGSKETLRLLVGMPPRTALVRVISAATSTTRLSVDGLPEPEATRGEEGQRLLVTEQVLRAGDDQIEGLSISLSGIPRPGSGRWYAALLSLTAMGAGVFVALQAKKQGAEDMAAQRKLLLSAKKSILEEILSLESARQSGEIGPKSYARERQELMDQLARFLVLEKNLSSKVKG